MFEELLNAANIVDNPSQSENIVNSGNKKVINDYMTKISQTYFALSISHGNMSKIEKLLKEHMEIVNEFHCFLSGKKIEKKSQKRKCRNESLIPSEVSLFDGSWYRAIRKDGIPIVLSDINIVELDQNNWIYENASNSLLNAINNPMNSEPISGEYFAKVSHNGRWRKLNSDEAAICEWGCHEVNVNGHRTPGIYFRYKLDDDNISEHINKKSKQ